MARHVTEATVDARLCRAVKALGGVTIKLTSLGARGAVGWPDRLVILPGNRIGFVEVKGTRGRLSPLQLQKHAILHRLRCRVFIADPDTDMARLLAVMGTE